MPCTASSSPMRCDLRLQGSLPRFWRPCVHYSAAVQPPMCKSSQHDFLTACNRQQRHLRGVSHLQDPKRTATCRKGYSNSSSASAGGAGSTEANPTEGEERHRRLQPSAVLSGSFETVMTVTAAVWDEQGVLDHPSGGFLRVVLPTALALLLCNMDRICMSVAIVPMAAEFGWGPSVQGLVQSAFLWGYAASTLLGGVLADRHGGKVVMAGGILWFSLASLLLPAAFAPAVQAAGLTLPAAIAARAMVGLGEGVALPSMNNLVATRINPKRRALALGASFSGFHSGNLLGLVLSPLLLQAFGWRGLFCIFGMIGLPLLLMWQTVVPASAATHVQSTQPSGGFDKEAAKPSQVGVQQLLSSSAAWAIIVVNIVNHFGYFIYLNWIPSYFYRVLGLDLRASAFLSLLPWLVMATGSSAAGLLADTLVLRGVPVVTVRKRLQTVAFLGPALSLTILAQPGLSPRVAVACMTAALGITSLGQAGFVANMSDIAPRNAGKLFGLCNTFGSLAGIVGTYGVGFVVEKTGSFDPIFKLTAAFYVFAVLVWNRFCRAEVVFA